MAELTDRVVTTGHIRIHLVEAGAGPTVLLIHGFPESWYSWRHQLPALDAAGYRAVAIDVRGYGRSSAPNAVEDYRMMCHVADNVAVLDGLGVDTAVIVGHDWGAPIAWHTVLLRPDRFPALGLLSVPYSPRGTTRPTDVFRSIGGDEEFYISYFQCPGHRPLRRDPAQSLGFVPYRRLRPLGAAGTTPGSEPSSDRLPRRSRQVSGEMPGRRSRARVSVAA